jgi:hypothetical protein
VVLVGVVLWLALRDDEYVAPTPHGPSVQVQPAPAAALLQELTIAVRRGDGEAAAALAPTDDEGAQNALRAFAENAEKIPLRDLMLRYLDALGGVGDEGEWPAAATLQYRFSEDESVASTEIEVRFASKGDRLRIAGLGGNHGASPVWLADPVQVRRTAQTLVVAAQDASAYSLMAQRAVGDVRRVVGDWQEPLVVEVAEDGAALDAALGVDQGTFSNIAGVTTAAPGTDQKSDAVHVFLNADALDDADRVGLQVVISHEAAHVALDAASNDLPAWLGEGLADYISLRDVDLPLSVTAAGIIQQVRREGVPDALPGDEDLDHTADSLGTAYEAAWLACRLLAEEVGEDRLVDFYNGANPGAEFGREFRRAFGMSVEEFTALWQRELRVLAR